MYQVKKKNYDNAFTYLIMYSIIIFINELLIINFYKIYCFILL